MRADKYFFLCVRVGLRTWSPQSEAGTTSHPFFPPQTPQASQARQLPVETSISCMIITRIIHSEQDTSSAENTQVARHSKLDIPRDATGSASKYLKNNCGRSWIISNRKVVVLSLLSLSILSLLLLLLLSLPLLFFTQNICGIDYYTHKYFFRKNSAKHRERNDSKKTH